MANPDSAKFLRLAQGDLSDARRMLELSGFRDSSIGFLLQQASEKALKAWIHHLGGQAPFSHDLAALMTAVDEREADGAQAAGTSGLSAGSSATAACWTATRSVAGLRPPPPAIRSIGSHTGKRLIALRAARALLRSCSLIASQ